MGEKRTVRYGRRSSDKLNWHIRVRENWYRDVWLLIVTALVAWAVWTTLDTVDDVREGRSFAVKLNCAAVSAVIEAGRATITGGGCWCQRGV